MGPYRFRCRAGLVRRSRGEAKPARKDLVALVRSELIERGEEVAESDLLQSGRRIGASRGSHPEREILLPRAKSDRQRFGHETISDRDCGKLRFDADCDLVVVRFARLAVEFEAERIVKRYCATREVR